MIKKGTKIGKIVEYKDLDKIVKNLKGKNVVLAGGCFDILHYGHLYFLKQASELGDILIVVLESDEFIINKKKKQPIHNQVQRAEILSALEIVDIVVKLPFFSNDKDYFNMVKLIKPSIIAVTEGDRQLQNKTKQGEAVGAKVVICPIIKNLSSSTIINGTFIKK